MRLILGLSFKSLFACVILIAQAHALDGISAHPFITQNSLFYPEVNLLITNNNELEKNIFVDFSYGERSVLTGRVEDCKMIPRDQGKSHQNFLARTFYSEIGTLKRIGGIVPAKGAIHRNYIFGLNNVSYPCTLFYAVTDADTGKIVERASISLDTKSEIGISASPAEEKSLDVNYFVEKIIDPSQQEPKLLATLVIKNKTSEFFSLQVARKSLIDCSRTTLETSLLPGLDGSAMLTKPLSYSTALTLLRSDADENTKCALELELVDLSTPYRKKFKIPIKPIGKYDLMKPPPIEHPDPFFERNN